MFNGIGEKIKGVSLLLFLIEVITSIMLGLVLIDYALLLGFAVIIGGSLFGFILTLFMYGFGELIEKVTIIANNSEKKSPRLSSLHSDDTENEDFGNARPINSSKAIKIMNIPKRNKENK